MLIESVLGEVDADDDALLVPLLVVPLLDTGGVGDALDGTLVEPPEVEGEGERRVSDDEGAALLEELDRVGARLLDRVGALEDGPLVAGDCAGGRYWELNADTGRTRKYTTNTARKITLSTSVEGRAVMCRRHQSDISAPVRRGRRRQRGRR